MRKGRLAGGIGTVAFVIGCLAPKAEPIQGDVRSAIQEGIDEGTGRFDHGIWDEILIRYAEEGGRRFDYVGLKGHVSELNRYLRMIADVDLSSLSKNELIALFANAYNAYTVETVLERVSPDGTYGIESIRDTAGVFDREHHLVGGFTLSLNNIEHNILRPLFKDPRIHFVLNCASVSCPPLPVRAINGDDVDEQLEESTRSVLSSPDYVRIEDGELLVSRILDWYGSDFVTEGYRGAEKNIASFIRKYASDDVRRWIDSQPAPSIEFMTYDWSLNRTR